MATDTMDRHDTSTDDSHSGNMERKMYLRFAAMIVTGMVVMYWVMFVGSYEWSHIRFSQSRVFMALVMGGTMGLVMLGWMPNMYKNTKANVAIIAVSLVLMGLGTFLERSQRSAEHTYELQSLMRRSYAVF